MALEAGDKLFTKNDAGYLLYVGNGKAQAFVRSVKGDYIKNGDAKALNDAQTARWIDLKSVQGAEAHMS